MGDLAYLYFACRTFGALPVAGGILDQPSLLMDTLLGFHAGVESEKQKRLERELEKAKNKKRR